MANPIDRVIGWLSPAAAVRRAQARAVLAYYESGRIDHQRKQRKSTGSGDAEVARAGVGIRQQARHLDENHDLVRGILTTLLANVVGSGIGVEPQPRNADGSIHREWAQQIRRLWDDWQIHPEVTFCHDWAAVQRIVARTWLRDGESLAHFIEGLDQHIDHGTRVPLSLELLEPDYLPLDLSGSSPRITQGVETNAWGRPVAYHLYRDHPGDAGAMRGLGTYSTKRIPAYWMLHLAMRDRLHQVRGVSVLASVLSRLDDLKDYEESERVAAKVAASMAAYIRKGSPDSYVPESSGGEEAPRDMRFRPGMVFDDLLPGEEIGTIDTRRPSQQLEPHRNGQLRAIASGTYCTYSSASKNYDGTYSAQRQELVEGWGVYGMLQSQFIGGFVRPIYERFIGAALASGELLVPRGVMADSSDDAMFLAPQMPWIDPRREAESNKILEANGYASGPEIIRRRGQDPETLLRQEAEWRSRCRELGISLEFDTTSDANATSTANSRGSIRAV